MDKGKDNLRLGELLLAARLLSPQELAECIEASGNQGLPIGRIMVIMGLVSEQDLRSALKVQSLVRDAIVPFHIAVQGLALASREKIDADLALAYLGWVDAGHIPSNKLGELLLAAEIITQDNLNLALRQSQATGLPLGRILVSLGMLVDELLASALNAQMFVREGTLNKKQAIEGLRAARDRRLVVAKSLKQQGFSNGVLPKTIRLGQLFTKAEVLSEDQLWDSLAGVLREKKPLGEILIKSKSLNRKQLATALSLQQMIANRTLTAQQASSVLGEIFQHGLSLEAALAKLEVPEANFKTKVRFQDLLIVAGLVSSQLIDSFNLGVDVEPSSADALKTAKILLNQTALNEHQCYGALRCYFLVASGWLNMEQAILALNSFKRRELSFDEVLEELKWTAKTFVLD